MSKFNPRTPNDYDWDTEPTPPLDEFRAALRTDPDLWWKIGSGHHENLLDEALTRLDTAERAVKSVEAFAVELDTTAHQPSRGRDTNMETRRIYARLQPILRRARNR